MIPANGLFKTAVFLNTLPAMRFSRMKHLPGVLAAVMLLAVMQFPLSSTAYAEPSDPKLSNDRCLRCHGRDNFSRKAENGEERDLHVAAEAFEHSVHGSSDCVSCHQDIIKAPHRKGIDRKVGCVRCHTELWYEAQRSGTKEENARLGEVVQQIESYMGSIHARPSMADQSRTNATCYNCHDAHYIEPIDNHVGSESRLKTPDVCGQCHAEQRDAYFTSVHGMEILSGNANAAVCNDCHTTHDIEKATADSGRLVITENCGNCHEENLESYMGTYHGKVTKLGYAETAKCYDCHGSHEVKRLDDETSMMHVNNRLETCQTCHADATEGYITFQPHGTMHDMEKYPQMWFASTFMIGLLLGTFAFFWLHSALWFYREYQDRKQGKNRPHILTDDLLQGKMYFRRFNRWWRLAHLVGALSIMTLTLTGIAVLYAQSTWAPGLMEFLGGPNKAGYVHRIGAIGFMGVFFIHLIYFAIRIGRTWRTFEWFGPNSLIPNWQDLNDAVAMFQWFFGLAPRPVFDRFTYWEKFDYWAPFWGMTIIGVSGMMMWFPASTASVLPGWVFNVAAIVHGEEAFLAVVFLFTVHFFNNHFRPDKFPQDTTMFTGRVPLEIYRHEHKREYDRLLASGELEKYLVQAPSAPLGRAAKMLGGTLITFGLFLLTLVLMGFLGI
jgi:cytochrome b subunit of formate dehydrogenase